MTAQEIVARYYDAWQTKSGDLSDVPLADDFRFTGPVASFESAAGYRGTAREAGQAVTSFCVRRQIRRRQHRLLDHRLGDGDPGSRADDVRRASRGRERGDRPRRADLRRRGAAARHGPVGRMTRAADRTANERIRG